MLRDKSLSNEEFLIADELMRDFYKCVAPYGITQKECYSLVMMLCHALVSGLDYTSSYELTFVKGFTYLEVKPKSTQEILKKIKEELMRSLEFRMDNVRSFRHPFKIVQKIDEIVDKLQSCPVDVLCGQLPEMKLYAGILVPFCLQHLDISSSFPAHIRNFLCKAIEVEKHRQILDVGFNVVTTSAGLTWGNKTYCFDTKYENRLPLALCSMSNGSKVELVDHALFDKSMWIAGVDVNPTLLLADMKNNKNIGSLFADTFVDDQSMFVDQNSRQFVEIYATLHALDDMADMNPAATVVVLLSYETAIDTSCDVRTIKEWILNRHTLEAVLTLPDHVNKQSDLTHCCCMVFKAGVPHYSVGDGEVKKARQQTFFGYFADDGFYSNGTIMVPKFFPSDDHESESQQQINRTIWETEIEPKWLAAFTNKDIVPGLSTMSPVVSADDWAPEAHIQTSYENLSKYEFYQMRTSFEDCGSEYENPRIAYEKQLAENNEVQSKVETVTWKPFKVCELFDVISNGNLYIGFKEASDEDLVLVDRKFGNGIMRGLQSNLDRYLSQRRELGHQEAYYVLPEKIEKMLGSIKGKNKSQEDKSEYENKRKLATIGGNKITISPEFDVFWQQKDFNIFKNNAILILSPRFGFEKWKLIKNGFIFQRIGSLKNETVARKEFMRDVGLFVAAIIQHDRYRYARGRQFTSDLLKEMEIFLPVKFDENTEPIKDGGRYSAQRFIPDFEFMASYMKKLRNDEDEKIKLAIVEELDKNDDAVNQATLYRESKGEWECYYY